MRKLSYGKNWIVLTIFLIMTMITPVFSTDKEVLLIANDAPQLANILTSMQMGIGEKIQRIRKQSSIIEEETIHSQSLKAKEQYVGQNCYAPNDSESCGIQCLECKDGECTRYNWIGVGCLAMLVINFLALAYWILLIRKKGRRSVSKDSLLTESGSIAISGAYD